MQERAIHISSADRQKIGENKAEDFIIKFDPLLKLQSNMTHKLALDKVTMTSVGTIFQISIKIIK